MSIETWDAEFYSEEAEDAAEKGAIHAIKHSIIKWKGLREEQLKKHGLWMDGLHVQGTNISQPGWWIDDRNCALCAFDEMRKGGCKSCPIFLHAGRACTEEYLIAQNNNQPEPMIQLLEQTLAWAEKQPPEILDPPT